MGTKKGRLAQAVDWLEGHRAGLMRLMQVMCGGKKWAGEEFQSKERKQSKLKVKTQKIHSYTTEIQISKTK